ncbi:MAG: hypothetical protein MK135_13880 [Polyangiaceae bacterium]|nr:hypothetical protein [Polyangiaceae bacterium]
MPPALSEMTTSVRPPELKRKLREAGFEVYRTLSDRVILAERIRDNLIMDSGVAARIDDGFAVSVIVRAQLSHFPGAAPTDVEDRAGHLAVNFLENGYLKDSSSQSEVLDPSNPEKSLDTCYEVHLDKKVEGLEALFSQLRAALQEQRSTAAD